MEAINGQDALAKLAEPRELSMVVTDLNMPLLEGIGLIQQLRAHPSYKYVPIVVLTTESDTARKQAARSAGATAWIVKPFRPDQLLKVVEKVLA
jgi:two-component system, chemotaxis family, chemotaxis protein CheY